MLSNWCHEMMYNLRNYQKVFWIKFWIHIQWKSSNYLRIGFLWFLKKNIQIERIEAGYLMVLSRALLFELYISSSKRTYIHSSEKNSMEFYINAFHAFIQNYFLNWNSRKRNIKWILSPNEFWYDIRSINSWTLFESLWREKSFDPHLMKNWHSSKKWFHGDQKKIEFKDFDFSMTFSWSLENTNELQNIFHCFLFSFWESDEEFWEKGFDLLKRSLVILIYKFVYMN